MINYPTILDLLDENGVVLLNESVAQSLLDKNGPLNFGFKRKVYSKSEDIRFALKQIMEEKFIQQAIRSEHQREIFLDITTYDSEIEEEYDAISMELVFFEAGDAGHFVSGFSFNYDPNQKEFVFENFITNSDQLVKTIRTNIFLL